MYILMLFIVYPNFIVAIIISFFQIVRYKSSAHCFLGRGLLSCAINLSRFVATGVATVDDIGVYSRKQFRFHNNIQ